MTPIQTIIFDFGGVLVDWNPHYLYDPYFGSTAQADYFLTHVCTPDWNARMDAGRSFADAIAEKIAEFPQYEEPIRLYHTDWIRMMGDAIPGMLPLVQQLKNQRLSLYGLTNWSAETFPLVRHRYPVFDLLDGILVSGEEHLAKPDPRIFSLLLSRYHIAPTSALFIDDNAANIRAARSVGLHALLFRDAATLRDDLRPYLATPI